MADDLRGDGTQAQAGRVRPEVLIETKLHPPAARKEWVERRELIGHLNGTAAKLVLVDAPAGFGKTTLVAQWLAAGARPYAWVSLDPGDDDPGRLWWHIACALQRACPEFGSETILRALRVQSPDFDDDVLPLVAGELAGLPGPVAVVLDDYHFITDRGCHDQVMFLAAHLPPGTQLVLLTRAQPPWPLARMRAVGELAEIRARELRFTPPEATALVHAVAAVDLSQPDVADLIDRTEGWPAGVYLAALSLRGHPSPAAFVHEFTGDNRFVVDFLAHDVLSQQPADVQQFLARTSVLPRFCAPLCDAVTGSADSAGILDRLERENLFVVALDEDRRWFRYHHLFGQVLRSELARTEPGLVAALHERASAWHRRYGSADEAIGHALAAGDVTGAIGLIARHWYGYVDSGRMATVRGWLRALGDDKIAASPLAAHCAAWTAALAGDQASVRSWLPVVEAAAEDGPLPDGMRSMQSSAALLTATFGFDGIGAMRAAGAAAVRLETDPMSPWYALARTSFGVALYYSGEYELAAAELEQAQLSHAAIALVRMLAFSVLAWLAVDMGRLDQAEIFARSARDIVADPEIGLGGAPQSTLAYTAVAAVHVGNRRLEEAREVFEQVLRSRRRWVGISIWPTVEVLLRFAPVLAELGEHTEATALLNEARQLLSSLPDGAGAQLARLDRLERRLAALSPTTALDEPLTHRERDVLRLLRGPMSLREIGQELYLSQNTIKTHTRAIYRKLGVSDRQTAVLKARDLGFM